MKIHFSLPALCLYDAWHKAGYAQNAAQKWGIMKYDYSNRKGGSILNFVEKTIGRIQNLDHPINIPCKGDIKGYIAQIRKEPDYKVFFTLGLFESVHFEIFMCLPVDFSVQCYNATGTFELTLHERGLKTASFPETLPVDCMSMIAQKCLRKQPVINLEKGFVIDRSKGKGSNFAWPEDICGFSLMDYCWSSSQEEWGQPLDDDEIKLYTLIPMNAKKSANKEWFAQRRFGTWGQLCVPGFGDFMLSEQMNTAIENENWTEAIHILECGVNPNRGVPYYHDIWGWILDQSYLTQALWKEGAFDFIKALVKKGAFVPSFCATLSAVTNHLDQLKYFVDLGCSVNAPDNCGYLALNRAWQEHSRNVSNEKMEMIQYIIRLGGQYQRNAWDREEDLQLLKEMGAVIITD